MDFFLGLFVFIFGAVVGSFLGVCIWRLPEGLSIVFPSSHCTACNRPIRPYDNVPLLSYLWLRGRCRDCGAKFSWRYPLVELITALSAIAIFWRLGFSWPALVYFVFFASLIVITFIDLEHQIIPDIITLPGIPLFFLAGVFILKIPFLDSILGILIGGGLLYAIAKGYQLLTGRDGMGGGDIKLLAMIGGLLGWQSLIFIVFASSLLGAVAGLITILIKGGDMRYAIPFGPFLSLAAAFYVFFGQSFYRLLFLLHNSA